ncbi:MAG: hypothetical protein O6942_01050, partial [Bacteroidetes bacterium]|nr:hypothetical protein [Bacteroidota bacterium]
MEGSSPSVNGGSPHSKFAPHFSDFVFQAYSGFVRDPHDVEATFIEDLVLGTAIAHQDEGSRTRMSEIRASS